MKKPTLFVAILLWSWLALAAPPIVRNRVTTNTVITFLVTNKAAITTAVLVGDNGRGVTNSTVGATPINGDGTASTAAQINALFPSGIITNGTTFSFTLAAGFTMSAGGLTNNGTGFYGNGVGLTNLQSTNGLVNTFIFPSQSNTLTMNNAGYVLNTSSNYAITNITGNVSGSFLSWASLIVSNASANNITGYCTVPAIRIMSTGSTNGLIVPTGKTAIWTLLSWGNTLTNYWNILQQ